MSTNEKGNLVLPCLRGRMGDWFYYVSLMRFHDIASRVKRSDEIHKNRHLSEWIQRQLKGSRIDDIVSYLTTQEQRFFNAIILGIHGGEPYWQEMDIVSELSRIDKGKMLSERDIDNLNRTFGILTLTGKEKIFAVDGQHRTTAINEALRKESRLKDEEVAVIFVAHKPTKEGRVRTRRLFSTLNRYARPVSTSEIIALDEEDNAAIITRQLMEEFELFENKIQFSKSRSISPNNSDAFTNIVTLYDIVNTLITNKPILRIKVSGEDQKVFSSRRVSEALINEKQKYVETIFKEVARTIPSLRAFFKSGIVDRTSPRTSLLFRPIGQVVFFSVLKVAIDHGFKRKALRFFSKDRFSLANKNWRRIFLDEESGTIRTEKTFQKYAISLILKNLDFEFRETKKDREVFASFAIDPKKI